MFKLFSTEFWIGGAQERIRDAVLVFVAAWLWSILKPWSRFDIWNRPTAWFVAVQGTILVVLCASGYSPLVGRAFPDLPMSICLAGFLYLSTGLGPVVRLLTLLPTAILGFIALRLWFVGLPASEIIGGVIVLYSPVVIAAIVAVQFAVILSMLIFGTSRIIKHMQSMPLPLPTL